MSASKLPVKPYRPSAVHAPDRSTLEDSLNLANAMLSVAAQERSVLRESLKGCIAALEDLQEGHPQDPLFETHGAGSKALKHARQLLRPRAADHPAKIAP